MADEYDFSKARVRAIPAPPAPAGKVAISIRLDRDVLEYFKAAADAVSGGSYQTMINAALRARMRDEEAGVTEDLRRVLREERGPLAKAVAREIAAAGDKSRVARKPATGRNTAVVAKSKS